MFNAHSCMYLKLTLYYQNCDSNSDAEDDNHGYYWSQRSYDSWYWMEQSWCGCMYTCWYAFIIEDINLKSTIPVLSLVRALLPSDSEPEPGQVKLFRSGVHMPLFVQLAMKSNVPSSLVLQLRMTWWTPDCLSITLCIVTFSPTVGRVQLLLTVSVWV